MTNPDSIFSEVAQELGLPEQILSRDPNCTRSVAAIIDEVDNEFENQGRRFILGLAMAFISMSEAVADETGEETFDDILATFKTEKVNSRGQKVNTLNLVLSPTRTVRLRPYYNRAEHVFVSILRRYDYPNMAPHATQAWRQHENLLRSIFRVSPSERKALAQAILARVLAMPEHKRRSTADASPRPFEVLLESFPGTQRGEPAGALLQGLAFAYYRADSPNVTIETGKVGAGSRRTGRVGDIDGWNGRELVLSIEVKDEDLTDANDSSLDGFIANLAEWPDATAIVVAKSADDVVAESLGMQAVGVLTRSLMKESVLRWDLNKQRLAAREVLYYLIRVQRHSGLIERFERFLLDREIDL